MFLTSFTDAFSREQLHQFLLPSFLPPTLPPSLTVTSQAQVSLFYPLTYSLLSQSKMRLMSFCVWLLALCGTPVDSAEVNLLDYNGFRPCDVTLTLEEPCEREEDDIKCPYLFNVPPLTIHLPKQLRELERIVEELQMLKDNVDELRRMCADCTVRQTGRECERESDSMNERMNRNENGRNWLNADSLKYFSPEHGTKRLTSGNRSEGYTESDAEKIVLEEKDKSNGGAERQSTAGVINEEKREDGKQVVNTNGTFPTQREAEDKWATNAGGSGKLVDLVLKKREGETDDREGDRNGKENSRGAQEDLLENREEIVIIDLLKKQEKTDDNDPHVSQDRRKEIEIKTQSKENRSSYVKNMSDFHGEHTNKWQQQHVEERKKETEKGIKVERGNEKLKQVEGKEREKASRKGEVEEKKETGTGQEIKIKGEKLVQSAQTDDDGGLSSSKETAKTNFASKAQTPSTSPGGPRHESVDSNAALSSRSSHGSPTLTSLNSPFSWINKDLTTTSEGIQVQTIDLSASFITEPSFRTTGSSTTAPVNARLTSATPVANLSRVVRPTMETITTTTKIMTMAASPEVSEHHNSTARKNIRSNIKTGIKLLPGAKNPKIKNAKINNSHNQAPLADKKTKHDQKQKPPHHKPVTKPRHKDPQLVQGLKPNQRTGNLPADLNLKNTQTQKNIRENTTNQNLTNIQNSNFPPKPFLPAQRPMSRQRNQPVNVNNPVKHPPTEQRPKSTEIPNITQNQIILRLEKKRIHLLKTERTLKKSAGEEKPKLNQNPELNQRRRDFSENTQTTNVTPQPFHKPGTELLENADANPLAGTKDLSSAQKVTPSPLPNKLPSQSHKTSLTPDGSLEPGTMSSPNQEEAETELRPKLPQTHTEKGLETPQHSQTPRCSSKPASEQNPEAESSNVPLSKQRSHTRPAEMPGATSAGRLKASFALKPISKTETDLDPLEMTRATSHPLKTSQTNTLAPPGSAKPFTGVNIHPAETEVSSVRVMTQDSKTYSSLEDGINLPLNTLPEHFPVSPDSRIISDLKPQTSAPTPSIQATTTPNRVTSRILPSVFHESGPEPFYSKPKNDGESKHGEEDVQIQTNRKAQIPEHDYQHTAGLLIIQNREPHLKPAPPIQSSTDSLPDPPTESGETLRIDLNSNPELTTADSSESEPDPDGGSVSAIQQAGSEGRRTLKQLPPKPVQTPLTEIKENSANSEAGSKPVVLDQNLDSRQEVPQIKPKPVPAQKPGLNQSDSTFTIEPETENNPEPDKTSALPDLTPDPIPKPVSDGALGAGHDETSSSPLRHRSLSTPTAEPGATSAQKSSPLFPLKSDSKPKTELDPPQVTSDPLQNSQMNFPPSSGPVKLPNNVTDSLGDTEVSTIKMTTLDPKTSSSRDGQTIPHLHTLPGDFPVNPNSRIMSRQKSQTTAAPPSIQMTKSPNRIIPQILSSVPPSNSPTQPKQASNVDSKLHHNMEETTKSQIYDSNKMMKPVSSSSSSDLRQTSPAKSTPEPLAPDVSADSARELRVKINQVAAFFNNSRSTSGRHPERHSTEHSEDKQRSSRPDGINSKLLTRMPSKGKTCF